jgi:hypothetical protein
VHYDTDAQGVCVCAVSSDVLSLIPTGKIKN